MGHAVEGDAEQEEGRRSDGDEYAGEFREYTGINNDALV